MLSEQLIDCRDQARIRVEPEQPVWDEPEHWSSGRHWQNYRPGAGETHAQEHNAWTPPTTRVIAALRRSLEDSEIAPLIECNPRIQGGTPTFIGTRIPVYVVIEYLSDVGSFARVVREFPEIDRARLVAALRFAAAVLSL